MENSSYAKTELIKLLCERSFNYSPEPIYKLVSGRMSQFYINCKPVTLDSRGLFLIGTLMFEATQAYYVSGVGGLTFGADPIATATAFVSGMERRPLKAFSIRKEKKDHGISKWIEGDLLPGQRVIIVDDVATTGGSTIKAIQRARDEGLIVVKAVILIDRQEGGLDNIREHVPVSAIITKSELLRRFKLLQDTRGGSC